MLVLMLAVRSMGRTARSYGRVGVGLVWVALAGCSLPACAGRGRRTLCKRLWRAFRCGVACVGMFGLKVSQIAF